MGNGGTPAAQRSPTRHSRPVGLGLGLALLVPGLVLGQVAPALAHDRLRSSAPGDGGRTSAPPGEVTLNFGVDLTPRLATVLVRDAQGVERSAGRAQAFAGQVVQPLTGSGGPGGWRVSYRVVSSDGHPISGTYAFTVLAGSSPAVPSPSPVPSDPPSRSATTPEAASPAPPASAADRSGPVLLGLTVVAAAAFGAVRVLPRRRPQP